MEFQFISVALLLLYGVVLHWRIEKLQRRTNLSALWESKRVSTKHLNMFKLMDTLSLQDFSLETRIDDLQSQLADMRRELKTYGGL